MAATRHICLKFELPRLKEAPDARCGTPRLLKTNQSLANAPYITYEDADIAKGYMVMMIDPGAPEHAPIRHWLVVNIPGIALQTGNVGGGPAGGPMGGKRAAPCGHVRVPPCGRGVGGTVLMQVALAPHHCTLPPPLSSPQVVFADTGAVPCWCRSFGARVRPTAQGATPPAMKTSAYPHVCFVRWTTNEIYGGAWR
jgi:hypothetical protein